MKLRYAVLIAVLIAGCSSDAPAPIAPANMPTLGSGAPSNTVQYVFVELSDQTWRFARLLYIDYAGIHCAQAQEIPGGAVILREDYAWDEVSRHWLAIEGQPR